MGFITFKHNMMNANDHFSEYNCSEQLFKHFLGITFTEGAKAMADKFQCYWFLDIIASYQPELNNEDFQVWTLLKHEDLSCTITCDDGNGKKLKEQKVPFTDFLPTKATLWCIYSTILLPSEY